MVAETGDIDLHIQVGWWRCVKGRSSDGSGRVGALTAGLCLNEEIDMNYVQWWSECKSKHTKEHDSPCNSNPTLSFLMQGKTASSNKPPRKSRRISAETEAPSPIGDADHQVDGYSNLFIYSLSFEEPPA